ncbi:MAG: hypothetical protein ACOYYS_10220 [Chloroflexota bacterium]
MFATEQWDIEIGAIIKADSVIFGIHYEQKNGQLIPGWAGYIHAYFVMKTYKDKKYNIEIAIPDEWYLDKERIPILPSIMMLLKMGYVPGVEIAFHNGENEALNISIEKMEPEPTPEFCEMMFNLVARQGNYTHISYGRIVVGGRQHACVKYKLLDCCILKS